MEVSTKKWNSIFHNRVEPWNCNDRKRPAGCQECSLIEQTGKDSKNNSFILSVVGDVHADITSLLEHSKSELYSILTVGDVQMYTSQAEALIDKVGYLKNKVSIDNFLTTIDNKQISRFSVPVNSILGNHDNFVNLQSPIYNSMNFSYLKNGTIFKVGSLTIGILGGVFSPKNFQTPISAQLATRKKYFLEEEIMNLIKAASGQQIDILVTHQAPLGVLPKLPSNVDEGNGHLTTLLETLKPKYLIHGHHHRDYRSEYNGTKIIGLGNFSKNKNSFINFNILTGDVINP
jgi:Icc-related predicted phosphoesterase